MAKAWTNPEIKRCAKAYSKGGIRLALTSVDRSANAINKKMTNLGVLVSNPNLHKGAVRFWFAEEVADIFELSAIYTLSFIAEMYQVTVENIELIINIAARKGFDAYPMRSKQ